MTAPRSATSRPDGADDAPAAAERILSGPWQSADAEDVARALLDTLPRLAAVTAERDGARRESARLFRRVLDGERRYDAALAELDRLTTDYQHLGERLTTAEADRDELLAQDEQMLAENHALAAERDEARGQTAQLTAWAAEAGGDWEEECENWRVQYQDTRRERDALARQVEAVRALCDEAREHGNDVSAEWLHRTLLGEAPVNCPDCNGAGSADFFVCKGECQGDGYVWRAALAPSTAPATEPTP